MKTINEIINLIEKGEKPEVDERQAELIISAYLSRHELKYIKSVYYIFDNRIKTLQNKYEKLLKEHFCAYYNGDKDEENKLFNKMNYVSELLDEQKRLKNMTLRYIENKRKDGKICLNINLSCHWL